MKTMRLLSVLAILATGLIASANTFTANGPDIEPTHGYEWQTDRLGLINDGSFENGCDVDWSCTTDNYCAWIADLVPLGLWNYDGNMVAWLGGYCSATATCVTMICQEILLDADNLMWKWMAYVNYGETATYPFTISVTIDTSVIFEYTTVLEDHLIGYQTEYAWHPFSGVHMLCFEIHNEEGCAVNESDNYFVDYVETLSVSGSTEASFSTVKSLY